MNKRTLELCESSLSLCIDKTKVALEIVRDARSRELLEGLLADYWNAYAEVQEELDNRVD